MNSRSSPSVKGEKLHVLDARVPQELREHGAQGVAAVQVVRAVARDDEHVLRAQARDDEAQDVAARRVRPVQVLDDEHERGLGRPRRGERGRDALEELEALALALLVVRGCAGVEQARERGPRGHGLVDRGVLGAQRREGLGEGEIGEADLAEVHAVAPDDGRAAPGGELRRAREEAGLANPGVGAHEHHPGLAPARALDRGGERVELGGAGHEGRARGGAGHGSHPRSVHRHVTSG